jgi:hypothetical protein
MIAKIKAAVEARNISNHNPLYFFVCSIFKNLRKNKVAWLNGKKSFQPFIIAVWHLVKYQSLWVLSCRGTRHLKYLNWPTAAIFEIPPSSE